jgi:hypothetical protein
MYRIFAYKSSSLWILLAVVVVRNTYIIQCMTAYQVHLLWKKNINVVVVIEEIIETQIRYNLHNRTVKHSQKDIRHIEHYKNVWNHVQYARAPLLRPLTFVCRVLRTPIMREWGRVRGSFLGGSLIARISWTPTNATISDFIMSAW